MHEEGAPAPMAQTKRFFTLHTGDRADALAHAPSAPSTVSGVTDIEIGERVQRALAQDAARPGSGWMRKAPTRPTTWERVRALKALKKRLGESLLYGWLLRLLAAMSSFSLGVVVGRT